MNNSGLNVSGIEATASRSEAGGSARGISGDCSFTFLKVNTKGVGLPGALFSLYISTDFSVGAKRMVYSRDNGLVTFDNLPEGTFYLLETIPPSDYFQNTTVYKVVLSKDGFEIYYGANFEKKLSDLDNKIFNRSKADIQPAYVTLEGTKNLTQRTLDSGMFYFVVKDRNGSTAATGTNRANGGIDFTQIEFDAAGVYIYTVEEVRGTYSSITYDDSKYTVTVTVTDDGSGKLTAQATYPDTGVVFNNRYAPPPVKPCITYAQATNCRKTIKGQKRWIDDNNAEGKRPPFVKINLLRDGIVYKSIEVDSSGDGIFTFPCIPIWRNSSHKYFYQIDEPTVPDGYTKTIEGYDVINTLIQ